MRHRWCRDGLLLLTLVSGIGGTGCASEFGSHGAVKDILDQMVKDARVYYVPEGLPGRKPLLEQLPKQSGDFWQSLSHIQSFLVV